jgi:hypothetical protein
MGIFGHAGAAAELALEQPGLALVLGQPKQGKLTRRSYGRLQGLGLALREMGQPDFQSPGVAAQFGQVQATGVLVGGAKQVGRHGVPLQGGQFGQQRGQFRVLQMAGRGI